MDALDKANEIIDVLNGRKGFDDWWGNIDQECKDEILETISQVIQQ